MEDFSGLTVIDAGAGQADFAAFLIERGEMPARMIAIDAMPEMVEAIKHRGMNGVEAHVCDFAGADCADAFTRFGDVDSVVFSGSLNTLDEKLARSVLERAWEAVGRSLVFNFLSDRAPAELLVKPTEPAHRFDTAGMVEWALERTAGVWFRHDYLGGHDATIAMVKAGG
jgi:SAM-dependent methyltransferase